MSRPILEFDPHAFGRYVKTYRKANKISQVRAAKETGVNWWRLWRIEQSEMPYPRADIVLAISTWMNCDPRDFMKPREAKNVGR